MLYFPCVRVITYWCFVFEFLVFRFSSVCCFVFNNFSCFIFEFCVLRFRVYSSGFRCTVFEFFFSVLVACFRVLEACILFSISGCFLLSSSVWTLQEQNMKIGLKLVILGKTCHLLRSRLESSKTVQYRWIKFNHLTVKFFRIVHFSGKSFCRLCLFYSVSEE